MKQGFFSGAMAGFNKWVDLPLHFYPALSGGTETGVLLTDFMNLGFVEGDFFWYEKPAGLAYGGRSNSVTIPLLYQGVTEDEFGFVSARFQILDNEGGYHSSMSWMTGSDHIWMSGGFLYRGLDALPLKHWHNVQADGWA